ncbi:MAG: hypothetical protein GF320_18300 [Armatimonadia bacterium]|nr:hypothetical protein [Armatimonadia bacterium]
MSDERARQIFLENTGATQEQVDKAAQLSSQTGESLGAVLEMMGAVSASERVQCMAIQMDVPYVDLTENPPPPELLALIPREIQQKYKAVPVSVKVTLALANPLGVFSIDEIAEETGMEVTAAIAAEDEVERLLRGSEEEDDDDDSSEVPNPVAPAVPVEETPPAPEPAAPTTPAEPEPDVEDAEEPAGDNDDEPAPAIPEDLPSEVQAYIDIVLEDTSATEEDVARALVRWQETGEHVGQALVAAGAITNLERVQCQGKQWQFEFIDLTDFTPDPDVVSRVPRDQLNRNAVLPVRLEDDDGVLYLAMANPMDVYVIDSIQVTTGYRVRPLIALEDDIRRHLASLDAG